MEKENFPRFNQSKIRNSIILLWILYIYIDYYFYIFHHSFVLSWIKNLSQLFIKG